MGLNEESGASASRSQASECALSVVIPIYNEAECIADTLHELTGVLRAEHYRWEVLAINDGSSDETL